MKTLSRTAAARAATQVVEALALCIVVLVLCSCPDRPRPKKSEELVIHMEVEPPHLVVMLQRDFWSMRIASDNIFESLIRMNPRTYKFEGELASTWKVSKDRLTYTFYLRSGVRWHDGKPFTGEDVKLTFDKLMDEQVRAAAVRASLAPYMERYELVKPDVFRVTFNKASPILIKNLSDLDILPAHLIRKGDLNTHPFRRKPVGTGPYRFVSWKTRQQIVLERNDKYWGRKPRIKRLVYRVVGNAEVALKLARRGELHFLPRIKPAHWVGQVRKDAVFRHEFIKTRHYPPRILFIALNHRRPLFQDVRVRKALAQLLDLDTITRRILHGLMKRAGSLYWFKDPDYDTSIKLIPFVPQQASKLLAEASWTDSDKNGVLDKDGEPFRFTFMVTASSKNTRRWLTIYKEQLRKAGIVMEINTMEWKPYMKRVQAYDFDVAVLAMGLPGPSTDLFYQLHSSQMKEGQNYAGYKNPAVDTLLEQIRTEYDSTKKRRMSLQVQKILARDVALIPLFAEMAPGLVSRKVHGVYTSALWFQPRDWWMD